MGVYLPNMEMPTEGEYHMTLYVCSDGSAYIDVASFPVDKDRFEAVPVPPHGDLIDRNALPWEKQGKMLTDPGEWGIDARDIEAAPIIIPADPAEEGE